MEQAEQTITHAPATTDSVAVPTEPQEMVAEVGHEPIKKAGMPQLDPTSFPSQLFWLGLSFIVLYVLLSGSVLPRIADVLERRRHKREQDLAVATQLRSEAELAKREYEKLYADAKLHASTLVLDTEAELRSHEDKELAALDKQLVVKMQKADATIRGALDEARSRLVPAASEVTAELVKVLSGKAPSEKQLETALAKIQ